MEISLIEKLVENSVFAAAFVGLLYWFLARYSKDQREYLTKLANSIHANTLLSSFMSKQLLTHDAQVRGINPTVGDSDEERRDLAAKEYQQLHTILSEISADIRALKE